MKINMKKILISLSIIGIVAGVVVGGTIAFFNDTETSTGNVFTAGTIDLTIDSNGSSYNGQSLPDENFLSGESGVDRCVADSTPRRSKRQLRKTIENDLGVLKLTDSIRPACSSGVD